MIQRNSMAVFIRRFSKAVMNDLHPSAQIHAIIEIISNRHKRNHLVIFIIDGIIIISDRVIG